jgi:abhydrolase domain-containing protein 11
MAEDVNKFVFDQRMNKCSLLGHSMGGRTAMLFALKYPELVEKLIIVDISPVGKIGKTQSDIPLFIKAMRSTVIPSDYTIHQGRKVADEKLKAIISEKSLRDFLITNLVKTENGDFRWRINLEAIDSCFESGIVNFPTSVFDDGSKFEGDVLFIGGTKSDYLK